MGIYLAKHGALPNTRQVWVYSSYSFSHPSVLINYQARGALLKREQKSSHFTDYLRPVARWLNISSKVFFC